MSHAGIALVWCAVQVTLMVVLAAVLLVLQRRSGPADRAQALSAATMAIVVLSICAFCPWPFVWTARHMEPPGGAQQQSSAQGDLAPILSTEASPPFEGETTSRSSTEWATPLSNAWTVFVNSLHRSRVDDVNGSRIAWNWRDYVALLLGAGIALGIIRLVCCVCAVRSFLRSSRPVTDPALRELLDVLRAQLQCNRPVELRQADALASAATLGWRRPAILLPAGWSSWTDVERRAILSHELAHVLRNDFAAWVVAQVGLVVHFYHPMVHWLVGRLKLEQELAADAAAAELSGGRRSYLRTLAELALNQPQNAPSPSPVVVSLASTFLPTRRTFLRRIEMLRDAKNQHGHTSRHRRIATIACLFVSAAAVSGLRMPPGESTAQAQAPPLAKALDSGRQSPDTKKAVIDTKYVPLSAVAVIAFRPAELLQRPELGPTAQIFATIENDIARALGARLTDIGQLSLIILDPFQSESSDPILVVQCRVPTDFRNAKGFFGLSTPQPETVAVAGANVQKRPDPSHRPRYVWLPDDRTAILAETETQMAQIISAHRAEQTGISWASHWPVANAADIAVAINTTLLRQGLAANLRGHQASLLAPFSPLWLKVDSCVAGLRLDKQLQLQVVLDCKTADDATEVGKTAESVLVLARNLLTAPQTGTRPLPPEGAHRNLTPQEALWSSPLGLAFSGWALQLINQTKVQREATTIRVQTAFDPNLPAQLGLLMPAIQQTRDAAKRTQSANNLKQIGIALHNYHDVHRRFPPAVLLGKDNRGGAHVHSWRVALLPFLGQEELYRQYRFDEPWDSPHNRKITSQAPAVFRNPAESSTTNASYFAVIGEHTAFADKDGIALTQIVDGVSNTIAVVEAKRAIHWANPKDIEYDFTGSLDLGGYHSGGFHALICDGACRFISSAASKATLEDLLKIDNRR